MAQIDAKQALTSSGSKYTYFSIQAAEKAGFGDFSRLPCSLKVLLENLLRNLDGQTVTEKDITAMADWLKSQSSYHEIAYRPARVLMQDFTGVPAVVDLAAMREAAVKLGGRADAINPLIPVDLVIDHSVQVDEYGNPKAFAKNVEMEMARNAERYAFLRWGQKAFQSFRVVPPGTGICHQVNLEYLAKGVWTRDINGETYAYPDTLVGTDSHTTMINGLGVLGWGVGGIEAEAAMLGQPISMIIPEVIGVRLTGELKEGVIATDLVLTVTEMLRKRGVVGKFVEFFGPGLDNLPLADRATISNMAPEYGATCGFFPVDEETLNYMRLTGRSDSEIQLAKDYCQIQGLWRDKNTPEPMFTDVVKLNLSSIVPSLAGPKRPQDRVAMKDLGEAFTTALKSFNAKEQDPVPVSGTDYTLSHGDVVIAAITSCTNTSNPTVLIAAGLLAKAAAEKGLKSKPWVKASLAPGSRVVTEYLEKAGLQDSLDKLGFNLVGYGCTTCIGNSGPLAPAIEQAINDNQLVVSSVLSGNRNFEGRIHPCCKANWLASPPLVVAYALAGTTRINLEKDPLGEDKDGNPVYLKDIWPDNKLVAETVHQVVSQTIFQQEYQDVFKGDATWQNISVDGSETYNWQADSTYVKHPPFFDNLSQGATKAGDIQGARILALLGDSVTTDHISPAGAIKADSPAGQYLQEHGVPIKEFNSYGSRRGNHEVMMRGTFANIRIRNEMVSGVEGGFTRYIPTGEQKTIYDAAMAYQKDNVPLVVIAGQEYGTGSSRDWAAKGTRLLGVRAVIAESYERIHRSNLIGMGVLPLEFDHNVSRKTLGLTGDEQVSIKLGDTLTPGMSVTAEITRPDGSTQQFDLRCRIDTLDEMAYYQNGGILHYVLRNLNS